MQSGKKNISTFVKTKDENMNKTFNIYCDESTHLPSDGHPYMILAYVRVPYNQIDELKESIKDIKAKYAFTGEFKWTNVYEATAEMYAELIDMFFRSEMGFRAVIVDKSQIDETRQDYTFNDFYFRMYYQLLHHQTDLESSYNIYMDVKDTCSNSKLRKLKDMLKWNTSIRRFQFIHSKESTFLQLADVIMGAINYNLRINAGEIEGKVLAKRRIIDIIKRNNPYVSLDCTTPKYRKNFNLFFIDLQ